MGHTFLERFIKKNCKKTNQKERMTNYMSNGKTMIIHLIVELINNILLHQKNKLFTSLWP